MSLFDRLQVATSEHGIAEGSGGQAHLARKSAAAVKRTNTAFQHRFISKRPGPHAPHGFYTKPEGEARRRVAHRAGQSAWRQTLTTAERAAEKRDTAGPTEQTGAGPPGARPLAEDMEIKAIRFWNGRDLQYAVEDLTTAGRRFMERQESNGLFGKFRRKGSCEDDKKTLVILKDGLKELSAASATIKKFCDACEED